MLNGFKRSSHFSPFLSSQTDNNLISHNSTFRSHVLTRRIENDVELNGAEKKSQQQRMQELDDSKEGTLEVVSYAAPRLENRRTASAAPPVDQLVSTGPIKPVDLCKLAAFRS